MSKRKYLICMALVFSLALLSPQAEAKQQTKVDESTWVLMKDFNFPVWLAANKYISDVPPPARMREIFLYLESKDFTQDNIQAVVANLKKEYLNVNWLSITAFSDKIQLNRAINEPRISIEFADTPEGQRRAMEWYQKYYPLPSGYYRARYVRLWWGEELEYSPDPNKEDMVVIFRKCTSKGVKLASGPNGRCSGINADNKR